MRCPGQDTRFWKPDAIFEVPCQACGAAVEFFKTDARRRCPRCGKRIENPRISLGCAQWCEHAAECLGFDPKAVPLADGTERSLTERLVEALRSECAGEPDRVRHGLLVLDQAQDLLRHEGGDPRVVLAAALLHDLAAESAAGGPPQRMAVPRRILAQAGFEEMAIEQVCAVCEALAGAVEPDTLEARVVWDADHLQEMPAEVSEATSSERAGAVARVFRTESGRARAFQRLTG